MREYERAWVGFVLFFLVGVCRLDAAAELRPEEIYRDMLPSIITLEVQDKDGHKSTGTAFLAVKDGLAVTAWHVIDDAVKVSAKFADNTTCEVLGVVDKDEVKDIALIKVKFTGRPVSQLQAATPLVGSRAYVIGSPREFEFSISDGLISQVRTLEGFKQYQFTCPVSKGTSGSPVVNMEGKVVGVVSWSRKDAQNLNFAIPASYVLQLNAALPVTSWAILARNPQRTSVIELSNSREPQ